MENRDLIFGRTVCTEMIDLQTLEIECNGRCAYCMYWVSEDDLDPARTATLRAIRLEGSKKRVRQVRDALNKCKSLQKIERIASILDV